MAGSYPDVPSRRMAWDDDGTVWLRYQAGFPAIDIPQADMTEGNDEDNTYIGPNGYDFGGVVWVFPELRELDGFFGSTTRQDVADVETSPDATHVYDGTWTVRIASYVPHADCYGDYRTSITSLAVSSIRAVKWVGNFDYDGSNTNTLRAGHLYGEISAGQTPDRLLFIDENTGLEFTAAYDYGDIPRGSSDDALELRIRNNSSTKTATTIQYTSEDLYLGSGAWYLYTTPGGSTFSSVQAISSIAPATTSSLIVCRRVTSLTEDVGLHAARLYANTDSWV